jgi:sarcosine oxidase subunit gamma
MNHEPPLSRSSPVHDVLDDLKPVWGSIHGMRVALSFGVPEAEKRLLSELALCDVSCLPKVGLRGPAALAWLGDQGIPIPETTYEATRLGGGGLVIRTDRDEVFLEDGLQGQVIAELNDRIPMKEADVFRVERVDASFVLSGAKAHLVLAETCGFNFKGHDRLVMTRLAGVSCSILPIQIAEGTGFRIWVDNSYAVYLWQALTEIVRDLGGNTVGVESISNSLGVD